MYKIELIGNALLNEAERKYDLVYDLISTVCGDNDGSLYKTKEGSWELRLDNGTMHGPFESKKAALAALKLLS